MKISIAALSLVFATAGMTTLYTLNNEDEVVNNNKVNKKTEIKTVNKSIVTVEKSKKIVLPTSKISKKTSSLNLEGKDDSNNLLATKNILMAEQIIGSNKIEEDYKLDFEYIISKSNLVSNENINVPAYKSKKAIESIEIDSLIASDDQMNNLDFKYILSKSNNITAMEQPIFLHNENPEDFIKETNLIIENTEE